MHERQAHDRGDARQTSTAWGLFAATLCTRLVGLCRPYLSDDEAIYSVIGREIVRGARLYVDVVDHKPPGIYWIYAAAEWLAGPTWAMHLLHLLVLSVVWATAYLLSGMAGRWADAKEDSQATAWAAGLLYIAFTATMMPFDALAVNAELLLLLPVVWAMARLMRERVSMLDALLAGVALGIALLIKFQAAVQPPLALLAVGMGGAPLPSKIRRAALLLLGLVLPIGGAAGWLITHGQWSEALYWFGFNLAYVSAGMSRNEVLSRAAFRIAFVVLPALLLYLTATRGAWAALRRRNERDVILLLWIGTALLAVMAGGRFFGHYFHLLTAPLVLLAAPLVADLWSRRRTLVASAVLVPVSLFAVTAIAPGPFVALRGRTPPRYPDVVQWFQGRAPGSICVWGNSPELVARLQRPLGCRFVFANYLTGASPATASQTDATVDASPNIAPGAWSRFEQDLRIRQPAYLLDASFGDVDYYGKFPPSRFSVLRLILVQDYVELGTVAGFRVYQRRSRNGVP